MADDQYRQLITRVVREVLAQLPEDNGHSGGAGPPVCVGCSAASCPDAVLELRALLERGYRTVSVATARGAPAALIEAAAKLSRSTVTGEMAPLPEDAAALVLPDWSLADASKVALGIIDDVVPAWVWHALDRSIPVIATAGDGFVVGQRGPRQRLAAAHLTTCTQFGVEIVEPDALASAVSSRVQADGNGDTLHVPSTDQRMLITESMASDLAPGTRDIVLPPNAVVTPLARDMLRRNGVTIRRSS